MSATDKLRKASGSTRPVVTTLSLPKANGSTTAELTSATGWNTTTGVDVVMYRRQLNTTTGLYEKIDGTQTDWTAQLTGTTLSGMILQAGTEPASGYAADNNTVVLAGPTAQWGDDLIETLLTLFNQDQTLKSAPIRTALGISSDPTSDWNLLNAGVAPTTVTNNGNGSYNLVFNGVDLTSVVSPGMRFRSTRTVAGPTQTTSLNGTTQRFNRTTTINGMTFTNNFVVGAWIKLSSYPAVNGIVMSRYNGTSGWQLNITSAGQVSMAAYNAGGGNSSGITSIQSIPINKWVHIAAQLDMATFTATPTTSYIMINGVDVTGTIARGGTNPTSLLQAGNLEVGSWNGGLLPFPGKISQAFVTSAKVTQANILTLYSQGLTPALITANNIISAYSFNNDITDLNTTNANNLTAQGAAAATAADSFCGGQADGTISSTLDYCIVQKGTYAAGNTTFIVQVPEGCTIPTSGGVSNVYFSSAGKPYGMPVDKGKWIIRTSYRTAVTQATPVNNTWYNLGSTQLNIPVGAWMVSKSLIVQNTTATNTASVYTTLSTSSSSQTDSDFSDYLFGAYGSSTSALILGSQFKQKDISLSAAQTYYLNTMTDTTSAAIFNRGDNGTTTITAENAYL